MRNSIRTRRRVTRRALSNGRFTYLTIYQDVNLEVFRLGRHDGRRKTTARSFVTQFWWVPTLSALLKELRAAAAAPRRKLTPTTSDESSALSGKASEGLGAPAWTISRPIRGDTPRRAPHSPTRPEGARVERGGRHGRADARRTRHRRDTPRRRGGPRSPPRRRRRAFHPHAHAAGHEPARDALDTVDAPRALPRVQLGRSATRARDAVDPPRALPRVQLGRSATRARDAAPGTPRTPHPGSPLTRGSRSSSRTRRPASLVSRRRRGVAGRGASDAHLPRSPLVRTSARRRVSPARRRPRPDARTRLLRCRTHTRGGGAARPTERLQPTLRRHWRAAAELHPGRRVVGVRAAGAVPDAQRAGGAEEGARREARAAGACG